MLLNIPQCTRQMFYNRIIQPQTSVVKLRSFALGDLFIKSLRAPPILLGSGNTVRNKTNVVPAVMEFAMGKTGDT